jgi:hypothetical protein
MTPHPEATATPGTTPAAMPSGTAHAAPYADRRRPSHRHVAEPSLNRLARSATVHCLTGCATGEVLGMVVGTALEWTPLRTVALAVVLAFVFGYALTSVPLLRSRMTLGAVVPIALAADTISITVMEIVDNAIMVVIPGAMNAGVDHAMFWASLGAALRIAGAVAYPARPGRRRRPPRLAGRGHRGRLAVERTGGATG